MTQADEEFASRLKRIVRMVFQDLLVNLHSDGTVWKAAGRGPFAVARWDIALGESNAGTLQLTCAGIETFGRLLLGEAANGSVSKKAFIAFIENYFPATYQTRGLDIYETYRCGLLHSHYLGFGSDKGFFPTRGSKQFWDRHLQYTDLAAKTCSMTKTAMERRLIINVETFAADFQKAVEAYVQDALAGRQKPLREGTTVDVKKGAETSLAPLPVDYDYKTALSLQDATVSGTTTSS